MSGEDVVRAEAQQVAERVDATYEALQDRKWDGGQAVRVVVALADGGFFNPNWGRTP